MTNITFIDLEINPTNRQICCINFKVNKGDICHA